MHNSVFWPAGFLAAGEFIVPVATLGLLSKQLTPSSTSTSQPRGRLTMDSSVGVLRPVATGTLLSTLGGSLRCQLVFCECRSVGPSPTSVGSSHWLTVRHLWCASCVETVARSLFEEGWWLWLLLLCSRPSTRLGLWGRRYETDLPYWRAHQPTILLLQFAAFGS